MTLRSSFEVPVPLDAIESRLVSTLAARAESLLADLSRLVSIPTGGGHAPGLDECRGLLTDRLARLGATITLEPGDPRPDWILGESAASAPAPVAVARRVGPGPRVLLCGHLDTVHDPRGPFQRLELSADRRRATGPGAADMKGGLLVAVAALEALADAGLAPAWTFILNSDEETGSYCSDRVLRAVAAEGHAAGLVFEPALPDGSLVTQRPGSGQFALRATGTPAHVGRDFAMGVSAITALAEKILAISRHADPARGKIVNVGVIKGGAATNIVPDEAWAWGNVRFGGTDAATSERELAAALDALAGTTPAGAKVEVLRSFARPAKPMTPGVERLAHAARAAAEDLGQTLPFGTTGGVCDGNNLQAAGIPVIDTLGVRGGGLHTPDEWIEVPSLVERAQLAAVLIARLTRT
jgi:glutamate carboxypeptidase